MDLFPESEYQNGLKKILQVITPDTLLLRSKPRVLSVNDVIAMLRIHGFFDSTKNPDRPGFSHKYKLKEVNGDKIIVDEISCLLWQQSGSSKQMEFEDAKKLIKELNQKSFAYFDDWRLLRLRKP